MKRTLSSSTSSLKRSCRANEVHYLSRRCGHFIYKGFYFSERFMVPIQLQTCFLGKWKIPLLLPSYSYYNNITIQTAQLKYYHRGLLYKWYSWVCFFLLKVSCPFSYYFVIDYTVLVKYETKDTDKSNGNRSNSNPWRHAGLRPSADALTH